MLVGLDEAGVGPAFGSLWACAAHIPNDVHIPGLTDSKKLTEKRRDRLRKEIMATCVFGLGEVTQKEIDARGLGEARRLVFERALDDLVTRHPDIHIEKLIVDGTIFRKWRDVAFECIPKADQTVSHVSAASVLAKTTRDEQVRRLCDDEPTLHERYGIRNNKGYLSATHIAGIKEHGYSEYHRRSYTIRGLRTTE